MSFSALPTAATQSLGGNHPGVAWTSSQSSAPCDAGEFSPGFELLRSVAGDFMGSEDVGVGRGGAVAGGGGGNGNAYCGYGGHDDSTRVIVVRSLDEVKIAAERVVIGIDRSCDLLW